MLRMLLLLSAAFAHAPALLAQAVPVPAEVSEIITFGTWEEGEAAGRFRAIVTERGFEHIHNELYLEWVAEDEAGPGIIASVPVRELNEPGVLVFGAGASSSDEGATFLTVPFQNTYTLEEGTVRLKLGEPGEYAVVDTPPVR